MLLTSQMDFVVVVQPLSCVRLCNPMDCSTSDFPVLHHLPELAETHVRWVDDAIQPSCPLSPPSPPAINLSQHHSLFQWVYSLQQMVKELELQHQSFQWILRIDFLQGRWPRGATPRPRSGVAAESSYSMFKVRRGGSEEIPLFEGRTNPSKVVGVARGHQRADTLKP